MNPAPPVSRFQTVVLLAVLVSAIGFAIYRAWWPKTTVVVGDSRLRVILADTVEHRLKGLSGRKKLAPYDGMLFVFPEQGEHSMAMRGMLFPLDIVWIDGQTIVDIAPNLEPEPGKAEWQLTPYFSRAPSTLVLELPAGSAERLGLKVGGTIKVEKGS